MARIKHNSKEIGLLARLMRSEAVGEGRYGQKLVGNVTVNRVKAKCGTFKNVNSLTKVIYQRGQYDGVRTKLFYGPANGTEKRLAKDCIDYWRGSPATNALFYRNPGNVACPRRFYGPLAGRYKKHCFYNSDTPVKCGI